MIDKYRKEILYLLSKRQILIIVGETGSGKSTRIPQILYEAGIFNQENDFSTDKFESGLGTKYKYKVIGVTEPRRVAAAQLAERVASNMRCPLGSTVGYAVRFKDETNLDRTQVKFITEGLLIREMMSDPLVRNYSVIMVDEAHERSINTDALLGFLKCILLQRNDLKLIICSATLNIDVIQKFFTYPANMLSDLNKELSNPPDMVTIKSYSHPVKIFYKTDPVPNYLDASVETVMSIHESIWLGMGKILIFLTGQDEVDYVCERLNDYALTITSRSDLKKLLVLPLHASLKPEQISKAFDEHGRDTRLCIVSTNVAETSLTINGVAFVIDCGFVKMKIFDPKTGIDTLMRLPVSKSSAKQRAGRAGRTRDGFVYRLYSEKEFSKLQDDSVPEIQRSSLSEFIMLLLSLGVENILQFPLLSPMPKGNLVAALEGLYALQAIDDLGNLTKTGQIMSQLNLDPKLSRMLVSIQSTGCIREVCRVAAILQVKDIYNKPSRQSSLSLWSNEGLTKLCALEGDMLSYLNILNKFIECKLNPRWAERKFLNHQALINALEISTKLESQLKTNGISATRATGRAELVQKAIVSGLFANAAYLHPSGDYKTIRGEQTVHIHPTSVFYEMAEDRPKYVVFGEILDTTKTYMRHIMAVERDWLLDAAPHYYKFDIG